LRQSGFELTTTPTAFVAQIAETRREGSMLAEILRAPELIEEGHVHGEFCFGGVRYMGCECLGGTELAPLGRPLFRLYTLGLSPLRFEHLAVF